MAYFSAHFLIPLFPLTLFFIFLYKWQSCNNHHATIKRLLPSPVKLPMIGNIHQLGSSPHRSLHSLSRKPGPLMLLRFGRVSVLVVSSADAAREIMKNQDSIFSNRPKLTIPNKIFYSSKDVVYSPYGEYWRKMRGICVHQLTSPKTNMFAYGMDTAYSVMEWTMAELLKHPNAMAKLQQEVKQSAGDKREITDDDLEKLHCLNLEKLL